MAGGQREIKLCMLGETQVGKTSLVIRFAKNNFNPYSEPTIGASYMSRKITYQGTEFKYNIWDTAGQERFKGLASLYYRGAAVAIIVYDVTEESSFEKVNFWMKEVERNGPPNIVCAIAANKCDLDEKRVISTERGRQYAESMRAVFVEVSAKTSKNVELLFTEICKHLPNEESQPRRPNYGLPQQQQKNEENSKCC